ncbi:MAG: 3-dehydroquinate synthase family protein [Candidatus Cryptobacteroides sp.]
MRDIDIHISSGEDSRVLYRSSCRECAELAKGFSRTFVICDRNLADSVGKTVVLALKESGAMKCDDDILLIDATEKEKNLETVARICGWLLDRDADRNCLLIGIGGGITTDLTGFAAAIYKRGVRCGFIPTTLLAQVDAAVGGKNGVNFEEYKNILGVTRQPVFILICPDCLSTLSHRDFLSGAAELMKTFIISDRGNYAKAVETLRLIEEAPDKGEAIASMKERIAELVYEAAKVKAEIVGKDPFEKDQRRKLNLGHTFAHAIEHFARIEDMDITHGEAVAIGTVLAADFSGKLGISEEDDKLAEKIRHDFQACGLPVDCPFGMKDLASAAVKDKKACGNEVNFVLIRKIGDVVIKRMSAETINIIEK